MNSREDSWRDAVMHYRAGVSDSMLAEYRCSTKGCLLLRVWNSPNGVEFYSPSARVSDRYSTAGQFSWLGFNRADDSKTGDRAGRLSDLDIPGNLGGWLWLLCEHVKESLPVNELRHDIADSQPGDPVKVFVPRKS